MEPQSNDLRERLLASLPQPENLNAYREETGALLAKHKRALRWAKTEVLIFAYVAMAFGMLWLQNRWHFDAAVLLRFEVISAVMAFCAGMAGVQYKVYDSQVSTLKEIKQVQLQLLEVQKSLSKVE